MNLYLAWESLWVIVFKNSPFGEDHFDLWPFHKYDYKYSDIFTGFVYCKKPMDFKLITGVNGLIDSFFIKIYKKRVILWKEITRNRIDYPIEDKVIYKKYNVKTTTAIENKDTILAQIDQWISQD